MYGNAEANNPLSAKAAQLKDANAPSPTLNLLNYLRESQNDTHDMLGRLESALDTVLLPAYPVTDGAKGGAEPQPAQSPLCDELERRLSVEHSAAARIRNLIDRLTV